MLKVSYGTSSFESFKALGALASIIGMVASIILSLFSHKKSERLSAQEREELREKVKKEEKSRKDVLSQVSIETEELRVLSSEAETLRMDVERLRAIKKVAICEWYGIRTCHFFILRLAITLLADRASPKRKYQAFS